MPLLNLEPAPGMGLRFGSGAESAGKPAAIRAAPPENAAIPDWLADRAVPSKPVSGRTRWPKPSRRNGPDQAGSQKGSGPAGARGFTSGPKLAHFGRVEWLTLDPFSAQAALSRGEIDWWESPGRDLFPLLARDRNLTAISHFMPAMGMLRFNQLYPPFDNPAVRRALLSAIDQERR